MAQPSSLRVGLLLLVSLVGFSTPGCLLPASENGDSDGAALGERWRSPVKEGVYETTDAFVVVANGIQDQTASIQWTLRRTRYGEPWYGPVSIVGESAWVSVGDGSFVLTPNADSTSVTMRFTSNSGTSTSPVVIPRRKSNALVGKYRMVGGGRYPLEILASSDKELTIRHNLGPRVVLERSHRPRQDSYESEWQSCSLRVVAKLATGYDISVESLPDETCEESGSYRSVETF